MVTKGHMLLRLLCHLVDVVLSILLNALQHVAFICPTIVVGIYLVVIRFCSEVCLPLCENRES